jgi:hypothetical protein
MRISATLSPILAVTLLSSSAAASALVTSTRCVADQVYSAGPSSCSVTSPQGDSAAAGVLSASGLFSGTAFVATQSLYATGSQSFSNPGDPAASASSDFWIVINTPGFDRSGFLELTASVDTNSGYSGSAGATLQIGSNSFNFSASKLSFCCSTLLPITLGQPLLLDLSSYNLQNVSTEGVSGGTAVSTVSLQFLEADASTTVPVFESTAPEPASFALLLLGVASILLFSATPRSKATG